MDTQKNDAVCLFIKAPSMGEVKTRLQPEINQENSLLLYKAMVQDIIEQLGQLISADVIIFFWPLKEFKACVDWLGSDHHFVPQNGRYLGERMLDAFRWASKKGYTRTLLIGSDLPTLDISILNEAFKRLNRTDVVLGPTRDGGYYLIGMKKPYQKLFIDIPWSTDRVYSITVNRIREMRLDFSTFEEERDIDTYEDVLSLWQRLHNPKTAKEADGLFHTKNVLYDLLNKRGELNGTEIRK